MTELCTDQAVHRPSPHRPHAYLPGCNDPPAILSLAPSTKSFAASARTSLDVSSTCKYRVRDNTCHCRGDAVGPNMHHCAHTQPHTAPLICVGPGTRQGCKRWCVVVGCLVLVARLSLLCPRGEHRCGAWHSWRVAPHEQLLPTRMASCLGWICWMVIACGKRQMVVTLPQKPCPSQVGHPQREPRMIPSMCLRLVRISCWALHAARERAKRAGQTRARQCQAL